MQTREQTVRFDDRLKTVLALRPHHAHDRAVRWRQLIELLARGGGASSPLVEQALAEVKADTFKIEEQLRAATARAVAGPGLPVALVTIFARDSIAVAAPVLAAAKLRPTDWRAVLAEASADSRRFLRSLHPGLVEDRQEPVEPAHEAVEETVKQEAEAPEEPVPAEPAHEEPRQEVLAQAAPSISDVIARIEQLRQEREQADREREPAQPAGASRGGAALFRWECGPSGEIAWVEGVPRGALIGRSLANPGEHNGVDTKIQRAFAVRAPFREAVLSISGEGAAAGEWKLSGVPAFESSDGRFAGYRGVAVRGDVSGLAQPEPQRGPGFDNDSIRELVHELKTPLNAIIGFAEIIDGQYLGPADFSYRERAAEIVGQARLLLSAIEDLDLAAQLRSAPEQAGGSTDLRELVARESPMLVEQAGRRGAVLLFELPATALHCGVEQGLAGRIVRRFCGSIVDSAATGERLGLALSGEADRCLLSLGKPKAVQDVAGSANGQFTATEQPMQLLSTGVSLRLVRALARVAGGDLIDTAETLVLALPRAQ